MTTQQDRINEIVRADLRRDIERAKNHDDAMIGSDEGTHGKPGTHRIYETVTGERYATYFFAGSNATRCTVEQAEADTDGRIIYYPKAKAEIKEAQARLRKLQDELRRCES